MSIDWNWGGSSSLVDLAFKATAWLGIVLLAWLTLGRRRPAIGSAIGHAGLLGLLLLPASAWLIPTLPIAILRPSAVAPRLVDASDFDEPETPVEAALPAPIEMVLPAESTAHSPLLSTPAPIAIPSASVPPPTLRINGPRLLLGMYAVVSAGLLIRLVGSMVGVSRLRRTVEPVTDPEWLDRLERLASEFGMGRRVELARSSRVSVPVVIGWLRPMILLPGSNQGSDPISHAEPILLHELAHVRRGDYGWNLILRVVQAIYWLHPLAWLLARAVVETRERACDAYCVHRLGGPSAYRAALLAMAEGLTRRPPSPALGMAMARSTRLGRRVLEIDRTPGEPRCVPKGSTRLAIVALTLVAIATLGPVAFTNAEGRPEPQEPKPPVKAAEVAKPPAVGKLFRLKVVGAKTGLPVPKADVRVWLGLGKDDWRKTDDDGQLDIVYATGPADRHITLDVWGDGFAMQRQQYGRDPNATIPDQATIKLQPGESLGGIVQDEQGRPVSGAIVYLWSHNYKHQDPKELLFDLRATTGLDGRWHTGGAPTTTGELLGFYIIHPDYLSDREYTSQRERPTIADLRAAKAVSTLKKGVPIEGRVVDQDGRAVAGARVISTDQPNSLFDVGNPYLAFTDADGRFRTWQVKPGDWHLIVEAKGHAPEVRQVKVGSAIPFEEIRLEAPKSFRARVVDPDGKPIAGALVNIDTWRGYRCLGVYLYSDEDGWVRWDDAPGDEMTLNIDEGNHLGLWQLKAKAGSDLTFTLKPSLAIAGTVSDAETRKLIQQAEVEYGAIDPKTGEVAVWRESPNLGWTWFSQGYLNIRFAVESDAYKFRIKSPAYEPFISRTFRREEKVVLDYKVELQPARVVGQAATILRPDGKPLVGARVHQLDFRRMPSLVDGKTSESESGRPVVTGPDGTFPMPESSLVTVVLILGEDCYGYAVAKTLHDSPKMIARPYGRIEGRYMVGSQPLANRPIELRGSSRIDPAWLNPLNLRQTGQTDADGRFVFEKVIPMPGLRVIREDRQDRARKFSSTGELVRVEEGKTTVATFGGKGRPVVGRVEPPEGWNKSIDFTDRSKITLGPDRPHNPYPVELFRDKTVLEGQIWRDWYESWVKSEAGLAYQENWVSVTVALAPDGSFRIDDVPSGGFRIEILVNDERISRGKPGPFLAIDRTIVVPPIPGGRTDEPLDLGTLRLKSRENPALKVGELVPKVEVTTIDGQKRNIPGDFEGKVVVLDFGAIWDQESRLHRIIQMNAAFAESGKNDRVVFLSLLLAADGPESRKYIADKGQPWLQAIIGPTTNPVAEAFGIESHQFPKTLLIGPDGRLIARPAPHEIGKAIAKALGINEPAKP